MKIMRPNLVRLLLVLVVLCSLGAMVVTSADATVAPTVTLAPTTGPVGTTVLIMVTGFTPNAVLSVQFGTMTVPTVPPVVTTDSNGAATFTITVPPGAAGPVTVTVTDSWTIHEHGTFYLIGPTVTITPSSGHNNTMVHLVGSNFTPGTSASVTVTNAKHGTNIIGYLAVTSDGTLPQFTFVAKNKTFAKGANTIQVEDGAGVKGDVVFTLK